MDVEGGEPANSGDEYDKPARLAWQDAADLLAKHKPDSHYAGNTYAQPEDLPTVEEKLDETEGD
jgi:hypothetical protein